MNRPDHAKQPISIPSRRVEVQRRTPGDERRFEQAISTVEEMLAGPWREAAEEWSRARNRTAKDAPLFQRLVAIAERLK